MYAKIICSALHSKKLMLKFLTKYFLTMLGLLFKNSFTQRIFRKKN